jgi:hypothetical protein
MQPNERWLSCSGSPGERINCGSCARRLDAPILGNDLRGPDGVTVVEGMSDRHICVRPTHLAGGRLTGRADSLPRMERARGAGFEALPPRAGAAGMTGENRPCAGAESW